MGRLLAKTAAGLLLALYALVASAAIAYAAPTSGTGADTAMLGGVNIGAVSPVSQPSEAARPLAVAQQLHAKVVRLEVPWAVMEPLGPGAIAPGPLAYTDRLAADAAARGIRLVILVENTPCWASSAPASLLLACSPTNGGIANAWPPSEPAAYAAFVAFLAKRYAPQLAAIEIWNEPDQSNEDYFAGPSKPERYAAVLRAAYPAIKQAAPQVPVLAGSLVGSNGVFLRALYAAGIKGYYDGLSVHFYNLTLASLRSIHEVQLANGDYTPLWLNEFGWPSCLPRRKIEQEQACVTPKIQAQNLTNTFRALARTPWVAAEIVYKLQDSRNEEFGLLSRSGAHKPAFSAFSHVLANPFGRVSRVTLSLRKKGGRVIASGSGPVGDFMELQAYRGGVLRYRALFTLNRFNEYSIALPAILGASGLRVSVYQYWSGPSTAAQKSI